MMEIDQLGDINALQIVAAGLILMAGIGIGYTLKPTKTVQEKNNTNQTVAGNSNETVESQGSQVNCPEKYRDYCESVSDRLSERIDFDRKENQELYFNLSDGRTVKAKLKESGEIRTLVIR